MAAAPTVSRAFDPRIIRAQFPALVQEVHGHRLAYLDNAATTQIPEPVIEAVARFSRRDRANVHRAVHALSERATAAYEDARMTAQRFLNARDAAEIVFVRGATEAINLVAHSFGRAEVRAGDQVVVSGLEHHSNLVPWQMLCAATGATLRVIPVSDEGDLAVADVEAALGPRARL